MVADFLKSGREVIELQVGAIIECQIADRCETFRKSYRFKFIAPFKYPLTDGCHEIRKFNVLKSPVSRKSGCEIVAIAVIGLGCRSTANSFVVVLFAEIIMIHICRTHSPFWSIDDGTIGRAIIL